MERAPLKSKKLLSIIVPVYNEEKTVRDILRRVAAAKVPGLRKEIWVVDDASTDGTRKEILRSRVPGVHLLEHPVNRGKGAAVRTAIPHTRGDFVIIQDADLEYDPSEYASMLGPLVQGYADAVYGSRFLGIRRVFLFWHYVANRLLTFTTNILYDTILTDMETCYKAFRGDLLRSLHLRENRFGFEPEVTAKILKRHIRLYECPITYRGRDFEEGKKITWLDGVVALFVLLRYRFTD
jgi:glycosyltransferase involved in cell wall biosynthesis